MNIQVWMYLTYLVVSIGLTVWVASTLSRNGLVFLEEVFDDTRLAGAVNRLLVVGFYLLNLGYVTVALRYGGSIATLADAIEELSLKVGLVLLVLGALHFFNVFALNRYRRGRLRREAAAGRPPLPPTGFLPRAPQPVGPTGPMPGAPGGPGPMTAAGPMPAGTGPFAPPPAGTGPFAPPPPGPGRP